MAAASHVITLIYGTIQGAPPYIGANPFSRQDTFAGGPRSMSFPTTGTIFHPTSQGIRFGSYYVYSIIEIESTGLNQPSTKYASSDSVGTLATNAG